MFILICFSDRNRFVVIVSFCFSLVSENMDAKKKPNPLDFSSLYKINVFFFSFSFNLNAFAFACSVQTLHWIFWEYCVSIIVLSWASNSGKEKENYTIMTYIHFNIIPTLEKYHLFKTQSNTISIFICFISYSSLRLSSSFVLFLFLLFFFFFTFVFLVSAIQRRWLCRGRVVHLFPFQIW